MTRHLALLGIAALLAGCSADDVDYRQAAVDNLNARQAIWKGKNVHNYDFDFERTCVCPEGAKARVRILVRNDVVSQVNTSPGGTPVAPETGVSWPTADSLFLWTRRFLDDKKAFVIVQFDTTYSYVNHLESDNPERENDETAWTVSNFGIPAGPVPAPAQATRTRAEVPSLPSGASSSRSAIR